MSEYIDKNKFLDNKKVNRKSITKELLHLTEKYISPIA